MDEAAITQYIVNALEDVQTLTVDGVTFFFHGPDRKMPFATLSTKDDNYDQSSNLNRPSVYRLNMGVGKETFKSLFGTPGASVPDSIADLTTKYDFSALDLLMPHPVYGAQSWACVLNPSQATFERVKELLSEAHQIAVRRHQRK